MVADRAADDADHHAELVRQADVLVAGILRKTAPRPGPMRRLMTCTLVEALLKELASQNPPAGVPEILRALANDVERRGVAGPPQASGD